MSKTTTETEALSSARQMDREDPLHKFRSNFHFPTKSSGEPFIYFCGNSLGLQPATAAEYVVDVMNDWQKLGVKGHMEARSPWLDYHEDISRLMARVVGAKDHEVVVMNTLTVNLHLMMVSFYRPSGRRNKILIEYDAFPSDKFAVQSQIAFHNLDPEKCLIELKPRPDESCLRPEDIEEAFRLMGDEIALVLMGNTNYYTGQFFNMQEITRWGHEAGCVVGFDCAHGAGNVPLDLHDSGCDFAVWCTYKYLNSGPGSIAGCFVHERHARNFDLSRFAGWWGHNKATRFKMRDAFDPLPGAEGWQLSNPPILSMAPIKASLDLFLEAGINNLRKKSIRLTGYLEQQLKNLENNRIKLITPSDPAQRGCQLSIFVKDSNKALFERISEAGVIADWREPGVIRISPTPLYNTFEEVFTFVEILKSELS